MNASISTEHQFPAVRTGRFAAVHQFVRDADRSEVEARQRVAVAAERCARNPNDPGIFADMSGKLHKPRMNRGERRQELRENARDARTAMDLQRFAGEGAQVAPFAYGTKSQEVTLDSKLWAPGTQMQWLLPKSGYIGEVKLMVGAALPGQTGSVVVSGAGVSGTPPLWNLINRYSLNVSFGYEYRGMNGDSLYFRNQISDAVDRVIGSPMYQNYNPASASTQTVGMILKDEIYMDEGIDFDRFLIPYQSFSKQVYLVLTTGQLSQIVGGSETLNATTAINITPIITYFTQPDTTKFAVPDTSMVQQILDEIRQSNTLIAGTQLVNLTPINGPEYLGLGFKLILNNVVDPVNINTNVDHIRLLANSTVQVGYLNAASIIQYMYEHFERQLPAGWFYLPWSDDISLINAMGPAQRNVFDTQEYTQLDMELTLKSTATPGAVNSIKLFKRLQSQAIPA